MARFGGASPPHGWACPRGEKSIENRYKNVSKFGRTCPVQPWGQRYTHNQSSCTSRCPSAVLSASLVPIVCAPPSGGKAPSVLLDAPPCSPCEPRVAVPARWCRVCACARRPVALARSLGCLARRLPCRAVPRGSGGVCVGASVWLPEARVAGLGGGSLGSQSTSLPHVFCDPVPSCSMSLDPLPWDITCNEVVCPDARTPCALPWGTRGLVSWCMISRGSCLPAVVKADLLWCRNVPYGT